jgi:hypothetical protein
VLLVAEGRSQPLTPIHPTSEALANEPVLVVAQG